MIVRHLGFGLHWREWISILLPTTSTCVLINGVLAPLPCPGPPPGRPAVADVVHARPRHPRLSDPACGGIWTDSPSHGQSCGFEYLPLRRRRGHLMPPRSARHHDHQRASPGSLGLRPVSGRTSSNARLPRSAASFPDELIKPFAMQGNISGDKS